MSATSIVQYPDSLLRQQSLDVTEFDDSLKALADNLKDTLYSTSGIGLCAPQIGHSIRLLIMDLSDDHSAPEVFVNPTIRNRAGLAIAEERCLSLPGVAAKVMRSGQVLLQAHDLNGDVFEREYEGMKAVCLQHEIDHLEGKLFIDRISRLRSLLFRRTLQALENNPNATVPQPV